MAGSEGRSLGADHPPRATRRVFRAVVMSVRRCHTPLQAPPRSRAPSPPSPLRLPGAGGPPRGPLPDRDRARASPYMTPSLWRPPGRYASVALMISLECAKDLFFGSRDVGERRSPGRVKTGEKERMSLDD